MLRNQFEGEGIFQTPIIPKSSFSDADFENLRLIGFDRARANDEKNRNRIVHFFLYDFKFERVWKDAEKDLDRLANYRAVLSPDFSIYQEMNPTMQLYNTFRNRWCGAYWANKGLRVIPTVSWGNENTFDFCFLGIPKGSTVAVSTYMVSEHDNRCDQKEFFMKGYRELLRRIEPERIICYNTPFPEMEGNIVFVDYELSSWKYQEKEYEPSPYAKYITRELPLPENSGIMIKRGYLISADKGMGSAYGGQWRPNPNKPNDMALKGTANTVQRIYTSTRNGGYWIQVKYGEEEQLKESDTMSNQDFIVLHYDDEAMRFKTISEFKNSLVNGGEIVIEWKDVEYGIFRERDRFFIGHGSPEENVYYDSPDELLEYRVGNDRLRDVITKVIVIDRTL